MCLAVVGKVVKLEDQNAQVDVSGNCVDAVTALLPEVKIDDYILLHAGFAIAIVSQQEYIEQQRIFEELDEYARKTLEQE